jgi:hypothetical protein
VVGQIEEVGTQEGLAAGDVDPLDAEGLAAIDHGDQLLGRQAVDAAGARGNQAMRATEVAVVVDLQPQLAQSGGGDQGGAARVGRPRERRIREEACAIE